MQVQIIIILSHLEDQNSLACVLLSSHKGATRGLSMAMIFGRED